jgi:hypothetical protein
MRPTTPLQWAAVALSLLVAGGPPIARVLAGPRGATVNVRWRASVTESERLNAEAQFRLADGEPLGELTWRYDLVDPSPRNIRALLIDPAVADTHNIDRSNGVLDPSAPRTVRRLRYPHGERIVAIADRLPIALASIVALVGMGKRASRNPTSKAWWARVRWIFRPPENGRQVSPADSPARESRRHWWTAVVMVVAAPLAAMLSLTLWHTPFPITEAVALFEDAADRPPTRFLIPDTTYYRPLFQMLLSVFWHSGWNLDTTLMWIKLLTIVPMLLLIILFVWQCRPRSAPEAVAAGVAVAVLIGSPGFRDNLELPLSYTIVGMAIALTVWILLNREPRPWHGPAVIALTLTAIGFKEQGLVLVALVVAAWWTRAPSASRGLAAMHVAIALAYVALRLIYRGTWPVFAQDIGLGFTAFDASEATARFGGFPYWVYAYNGAATVSNVLFSEPTRGVFRVVGALIEGRTEPWEINHLVSSMALTGVIVWWGMGSLGRTAQGRWSSESRVFIALGVTLLASGLLSFNYSRDRLGGMATVFYAVAAFLAVRAVATRAWKTPGSRLAMASVALTLLAAMWYTRAIATIEHTRVMAQVNRHQWLVMLPERRKEFAGRPIYLRIMQMMIQQGLDPAAPAPTPYPRQIARLLGPS